jgi:hypothetical protein
MQNDHVGKMAAVAPNCSLAACAANVAENGKTMAILRIELRTFPAHECERDIMTIRLYHHEGRSK